MNAAAAQLIREFKEMPRRYPVALRPQAHGLWGNAANAGYPFLGVPCSAHGHEKCENLTHNGHNNKVELDNQVICFTRCPFYFHIDNVTHMKLSHPTQIAPRLIALRKIKKVSQRQLCDDLNISYAAYNNYERAKNRPEVDNLLALSQYHSCTTDYILTGSLLNLPYALAKQLEAEVDRNVEESIIKEAGRQD